jgi:hypothetical protein
MSILDWFKWPAPASTLPVLPPEVNAINTAFAFLRPLGGQVIALEAAWKSKDLQAELAAGLPIVEGVLKVIGLVFPQAVLAERGLEIATPIIIAAVPILISLGSNLQPDGQGGWVSKSWKDDPGHKLNPDGSFSEDN